MSSRHGPNARRLPLPTPCQWHWFRKRAHVRHSRRGRSGHYTRRDAERRSQRLQLQDNDSRGQHVQTSPPVTRRPSQSAPLLRLLVFVGGFASIGVELTMSRLIAPYFGSDIFRRAEPCRRDAVFQHFAPARNGKRLRHHAGGDLAWTHRVESHFRTIFERQRLRQAARNIRRYLSSMGVNSSAA